MGNKIKEAVRGMLTVKGSRVFLLAVIIISFIPVVSLVAMWLYTWFTADTRPWIFQMMDYAIKIIDHIWTAQVVAGVMAYGTALVDKDGDGIPDSFENKK